MNGFIIIDRAMLNHHIVGVSNKDRLAIWLTLLCAAAWKDRAIFVGGKEINLKRGQVVFSIRNLADQAKTSRRVTERFITRLKLVSMIETETVTGVNVITVCNYDKYQSVGERRGDGSGDSNGDTAVTGRGQDGDIKENIKPLKPLKHSAVARARINYDTLQNKLCEAARLKGNLNPGLIVLSPILGLLDAGYSLDQDILPVIRAKCATGFVPKSWGYFVEAVRDAKTKRKSAGSIPKPMPKEVTEQDWANRLDWYQSRGDWLHVWGPEPGSSGCRVPKKFHPDKIESMTARKMREEEEAYAAEQSQGATA